MPLSYNASVAVDSSRETSGEHVVTENRRIRIVLVDDHTVVRAGFKQLIETTKDLMVSGEAGTAADALALAVGHRFSRLAH